MHSVDFRTAKAWANKKGVVVGTANSGTSRAPWENTKESAKTMQASISLMIC